MDHLEQKKHYIVLLLLSLAFSSSLIAQEGYSIEWVKQYPEAKNYKSEGDRNLIKNLIFGKKQDRILKPSSLVAISPDSMYIADQGSGFFFISVNNKEEKIPFRNTFLESFPSLVGTCMLPDRDILFTDSYLNRIFRFNPQARRPEILYFNDTLLLEQPTGIAYSDKHNNIWVLETKAHRVSILDPEGRLLKRFGERGSAPGQFNYPTHIWIDSRGYAFVVDAMNFRIQLFDDMGVFISSFGEAGDASGYFSRPKGIACDSYGHVYIADALFHVIQVFDQDGNFLYHFGGKGKKREQFMIPTGIFIDDKDYIYVSDSYNSRIQIFRIIKNK